MVTPINVAIDTPASKAKLFILVILIIGGLTAASFFLILRARRTDPPPKSLPPAPTALLIPQRGDQAQLLVRA